MCKNFIKTYFVFLLCVFLFFLISCKNKENIDTKKGLNNSFENAEKITYGITGKLNKEGSDYYYFFVDKKQSIIDFELYTLSTNALKITLFDFNKNKIKSTDEVKAFLVTNIKSTNTITNEITIANFEVTMSGIYFPISSKTDNNSSVKTLTNENESSKYYILVESSNIETSKETNSTIINETEYKLIINRMDFLPTDEREPNDSFNSPNILVIDSSKTSYRIDSKYNQIFNDSFKTGELKNREVDIYKVTNASYNSYILYFDVSAVPAIDTSIRVYDDKLNWLMIKDINIEGDGEKVEKLLLEPMASYYFLVSALNKSSLSYQVNVIASDINNIAKDSSEYIEFEVNNTPEKAMKVNFSSMGSKDYSSLITTTLNNVVYLGAIDYSNDIDYFSFTVPAKLKVNFSYFTLDSEAINITLSNATLGKIATFNQRDDSFSKVLESGDYYLIFERDKTKEAWKKGISKERGYKFSISLE